MRGRILLLTSLRAAEEKAWQEALQSVLPGERIVTRHEAGELSDIEIAIVANPPKGVLGRLPRLKWVQSLWAGVDMLLADETFPRQIPLVRLIDPALARAMAEPVATHVLALHRRLPLYAEQQRRAVWRQHEMPLAGERCVGVMGLGNLGIAAVNVLNSLGFKVNGWSRTKKSLEYVETFAGEEGLSDFLGRSEILVNLLSLTDETRGILSSELFKQLPMGAQIINFARGAHLVEKDLLGALEEGRLGHAVLDVFSTEPLPEGHLFWRHPKITVLPHVAALTDRGSASKIVAENIHRYRNDNKLPDQVDPELGY
ncbi:2-hydroxyacid dehydrogenase [Solemya velesiana gill symbiont]|uniref:Glyoxylate/hydroxypyruvate reductase A n=1 Tax=Solemya velesiana gill symbiont TaxID=1918948 RepID=A0A1T2KUQ2_9GAMM|nr:glyoxylate/hydroxypyruvate reductase A [Solemya velesiana gill symbiont]OOZ36554.1 glyoxylate/hydroxypyruvate reductase A [Solemya velesiana gill symbiont]